METIIDRICEFHPEAIDTLKAELDIVEITHNQWNDTTTAVYGNELQIACMKSILNAVDPSVMGGDNAPPPTREEVDAVDVEVQRADDGPLFFNLMKIMWRHWSHNWKQKNLSQHSSDVEYDSDDVDMGGVHVTFMDPGAHRGELMRRLRALTR